MAKKIFLAIFIIIILTFGFYQIFLKEKEPEFTLTEVVRGNIVREVFESGQVLRGERINLVFKNAGRIEELYVKIGDEVKAGQELAKLDTADIDIQLQEAQISLELAQLNLNKLLAGASPEEIKIVETQVESAQIFLETARENLKNIYETAITVLDNSYPQLYNTFEFVREFVRGYVVIYDQDARKITGAREQIEAAEKEAKKYLETAKKSSKNEDVEVALLIMGNSLKTTFDGLETIRQIVEDSVFYRVNVSAADRVSLDALKININSALGQIIGTQQTISSMKLSFQAAEKTLKEAENRLALAKVEARQVDIDLHQTQIRQAEARVRFYENQIEQSKLISPIEGKIIEIKKKAGEMAQPIPQDVVMVMLPFVPYEIKVNVYEEDVVKISIGNPVEITLVAFPGETFEGKITSISPAEKIIDGVVYYEVTVSLEEAPENIKPTMTADVIIQTDLKEGVLVIPRDAVQRREGKTVVEVFKDGLIEEREVKTGIRGTDDLMEVLSGLEEGEEIVIRQ